MDSTGDNWKLNSVINDWHLLGAALVRGDAGEYDTSVTGDPCIVLDDSKQRYQMFYFAQTHDDEDGREINQIAQAVSLSEADIGPGRWVKKGPIDITNPNDLLSPQIHKPWILMDPYRPNCAVCIEGKYWLFAVVYYNSRKHLQIATATTLEGPWTFRSNAVVSPGNLSDFDGYHVDTCTAYWFEERGEILIFYKGYPAQPQADQPLSPWGSNLCAAVMEPADLIAEKIGNVIVPNNEPNHWQSGWVGGLQIFPAACGGWFGLINGSPTPPPSIKDEPNIREPAPSLGGWAYSPETWPLEGWTVDREPIARIESLRTRERRLGVGVNLWRHHIAFAADGYGRTRPYLFCNSGPYGKESMFVWVGPT